VGRRLMHFCAPRCDGEPKTRVEKMRHQHMMLSFRIRLTKSKSLS
jgi:hypothetical protein